VTIEMTDNSSDDDLPLAAVVARQSSIGEDKREDSANGIDGTPKRKLARNEVTDSSNGIDGTPKRKPPRNEIPVVDLVFPVEKLYEYQWPPDKSGEYYLLQEHVVEYLSIKSFQRRFPDIERRVVSMQEREYLKERGVVTEMQCNLGLTAIKTENVCEIMAEEFPEKYQEYIGMVHRREMKRIIREQEAQRIALTQGKVPHFMKRALKETVSYNSRLNKQRREERCAYFDLQTQIIHYPQKKKHIPIENKQRSLYPVALMPGQYSDYYKCYTSQELKMLPLKTVLLPLKDPDLNDDSSQKEALNSSQEFDTQSLNEEEMANLSDDEEVPPEKKEKDTFCGICLKGPEMNKRGLPEKLISCSQCENSGHPSCLDMNRNLIKVIGSYDWQCMECKVCTDCHLPHDEEEMMFCDNCDRGYHSYCVGLKEIPKGRWVCSKCGKCSSCLTSNPVTEGTPGRWKSEYTKAEEGTEPEFLQMHCHSCSKLFRKGEFCPVCLKVYRNEDDLTNPMVCCDVCDRWIHTDCDGIDDQRYMELSKDRTSSYTCILCRGEKEERMDAFHKKNR